MSNNIKSFSITYNSVVDKLKTPIIVKFGKGAFNSDNALWDTGASCCCVSHAVVEKLSLIPIGMTKIHTPIGENIKNYYLVDIVLPNEIEIRDCFVINSEIGNQGIDLLIGMDVITKGDLIINNLGNRTKFSFRTT